MLFKKYINLYFNLNLCWISFNMLEQKNQSQAMRESFFIIINIIISLLDLSLKLVIFGDNLFLLEKNK